MPDHGPRRITEFDFIANRQIVELLGGGLSDDELTYRRRVHATGDQFEFGAQGCQLVAGATQRDIGVRGIGQRFHADDDDDLRAGNRLALRIAPQAGGVEDGLRVLAGQAAVDLGLRAAA